MEPHQTAAESDMIELVRLALPTRALELRELPLWGGEL